MARPGVGVCFNKLSHTHHTPGSTLAKERRKGAGYFFRFFRFFRNRVAHAGLAPRWGLWLRKNEERGAGAFFAFFARV